MLHVPTQRIPDFSRLGLRAYSRNQRVDLSCPGGSFLATLITISNYGARLKAPGQALGLVPGDPATFNLVAPEKGLQAGRIPCRITWVAVGEVEVAFARLLDLAMGEVQAAVDC